MQDLARLGVDRGVVLARLQHRERLERGDRELGPEQHRLQARDQRVAPEDGHEPRHPRRGQPAETVAPCASAARRGRRPTAGTPGAGRRTRRGAAGCCSCHVASDSPHVVALRAEAALDRDRVQPRLRRARGRRRRAAASARAAPSSSWNSTRGPSIAARLREEHLRLRAAVRRLLEHELVRGRVEAGRRRRRQRPRRLGVAEREVVLLDGDDVREVGADLELELERERLGALVAEDQVILHPLADEALARDRERVLGEPRNDRVAEVEGGGEVLDLPRREQERARAVDAQLEPREKARVLGEEPARLAVEVADLVADAERRALEDRQPRQHLARARCARRSTARAPSRRSRRCSRAAGASSANRTQSATSSGVTGLEPFVDGLGRLLVAPEAHDGELGLDEARIDGRDRGSAGRAGPRGARTCSPAPRTSTRRTRSRSGRPAARRSTPC